jgi:hypothetical protein
MVDDLQTKPISRVGGRAAGRRRRRIRETNPISAGSCCSGSRAARVHRKTNPIRSGGGVVGWRPGGDFHETNPFPSVSIVRARELRTISAKRTRFRLCQLCGLASGRRFLRNEPVSICVDCAGSRPADDFCETNPFPFVSIVRARELRTISAKRTRFRLCQLCGLASGRRFLRTWENEPNSIPSSRRQTWRVRS